MGGGFQASSHTLDTNATPIIYEEQASIATSQKIGSAGLFEIGGGYKVTKSFAAGVSYTHASNSTDATLNGSIPDRVLTDSPRQVTAPVNNLKHSENAVNLSAIWMVPMTNKVDLGVIVGPTIFFTSQDVPGDVSISEPGPTITNVIVNREKKTSVGVHFGVDGTYMLNNMVGIRALARYTWGSADLDNATDSLTVGGFHLTGGVRVRF